MEIKELKKKYVEHGYDVEDFDEAYQGEWIDDETFVQELLEDVGDMPKDMPFYIHIDWEGTARDVMMDYFEIDGHYFRSLQS